jgi:hypothetical protein
VAHLKNFVSTGRTKGDHVGAVVYFADWDGFLS